MRETRSRLADTGVTVLDFDILRLRADTDIDAFKPVLEAGANLGAKHLLVAVDDADESVMPAVFARACDAGREFGLTMNLEFMPWTGVKSLVQAQRFITRVERPNARILIDAIHLDRSGGNQRRSRACASQHAVVRADLRRTRGTAEGSRRDAVPSAI
jgi:sugar phosphate isomerase/epimerase